ncbi:MAG: iron chelate uptake ABC transporter family permease subunit [ANME-2 cluster archaeon]|jgi:iron complex transport system permease protein|nr:iron chelate uptake ABC transporter family permease subunit [ANME-2 cluster archaeon]
MAKPGKSVIFILALLLIAAVISNTAIGSTSISPDVTAKILVTEIFESILEMTGKIFPSVTANMQANGYYPVDKTWTDSQEVIISDIRLPRVLLAALVGAALSTAGCAMQGLLKNPMADPYIIGMSSGAALGASLAFVMLLPVQFLSFIGAVITIFVVYNISKIGGKVPVDTLLLSGIAVGSLLAAFTSLIIFISHSPHQIIFWLMGGLWTASWDKVKITSVMIIFGILVLYRFAWSLNVMLLGEEQAQYLGINIEQVKRYVLVLSALVTAAAVSVSGIIGFVGLIIPHIMRIIVGPDHRILFPASTLMGAVFLVLCDTFSRTIIDSVELPVGIVTAMFGAPFFIYLLRKRRQSLYA